LSKLTTSNGLELKITELTGVRGYSLLFRDLNFTLPPGRFACLSGPNGSGKTTLLRMIAGLIRPEAGTITCPEEFRDQGPFYLGHENGLRPNDTAQEHLRDWADLHHADRSLIAPVIERVGLKARALVPAQALSAGQKKRIGLARALIAPRRLWLLDEPAAALDVSGQALLCELIREHLSAGGLCLAALHDPLELQPDMTLNLAEFQP
jgi:heme ABC exporter, ATP-binding protein CcmA